MIIIKFKFKFFAPFSELFIINFAITKVISAYVLTIAARSPGPTELKLHKKGQGLTVQSLQQKRRGPGPIVQTLKHWA